MSEDYFRHIFRIGFSAVFLDSEFRKVHFKSFYKDRFIRLVMEKLPFAGGDKRRCWHGRNITAMLKYHLWGASVCSVCAVLEKITWIIK